MSPRKDMSLSEQARLIAAVRARPMLYDAHDQNYSSHAVKQRQWRSIASSFNMPPSAVPMLKNKWKMFRDTFARQLRLQQEEGPRSRPYRWAAELQFMVPHLRQRPPPPPEPEGSERGAASPPPSSTRPGAATSLAAGAGLRELDGTELAFLAHARTVRALSPLRQVRARAAVAQLLAQFEEEHLEARAARGEPAAPGDGGDAAVKPEPDEDYSVYFED